LDIALVSATAQKTFEQVAGYRDGAPIDHDSHTQNAMILGQIRTTFGSDDAAGSLAPRAGPRFKSECRRLVHVSLRDDHLKPP
jgi:hypothetical protein